MQDLGQRYGNKRARGNRGGFTLIEMVVVIAVIALLAAIVTPLAISVIRDARISKASGDAASIAKAIQRYRIDTGAYPFNNDALTPEVPDFAVLSSLNGTNPTTAAASSTWTGAADEFDGVDCNGSITGPPVVTTTDAADILRLNEHLLSNGPGFPQNLNNPRKTQWKGTYVSEMDEDPFGNKYLVNIANAFPGCLNAVYVLSAGPNGEIETDYDLLNTGVAGGDDIIARIR